MVYLKFFLSFSPCLDLSKTPQFCAAFRAGSTKLKEFLIPFRRPSLASTIEKKIAYRASRQDHPSLHKIQRQKKSKLAYWKLRGHIPR